ncbi:MAG: CotH kinase family protein [Solobacterium sp.]|nr:CotH kinase family protein [Solobacterium sp.]
MKKNGWLILLTIGLGLVFVFFLYLEQRAEPEEDPVSFLSFRVSAGETPERSEEIVCWNRDGDRYYVFLPSYADLDRTEIQLPASLDYRLDGVQLTQGMDCSSFSLNTDYELTGDGFSPRILQFVQSANAAAMYVDTFSRNMERVNADKSHKERAVTTVYTADGHLDYQGYNDIRGRGNSSWNYEKKPYNLYFYEPASLLEMGEAMEWVLIANASDNTHLRNKLIYDFADSVSPHPGWVPENEYVDLYLDGEYAGLYLLCERKENAADRFKEKKVEYVTICLNNYVTKLDDPDTALKLDDTIFAEIVEPSISTDAKYKRLKAYLQEFMDALPEENWMDYIDLDTFARKYLIEEIFANIDGGEASQYYYWDESAKKLYAGPCWDYDMTLGDATWVDWISPYNLKMQGTIWYRDLWKQEGFAEYVQNLYDTEFLPLLDRMIDDLPAAAEKIEKAVYADQIRWPVLYENSKDLMPIGRFLSERVGFLNSLWIDHKEYCEVSFASQGPRGFPIVSLYVPLNSPGTLVPRPEDMGIGEEYIWYRLDNDEPFDHHSVITGDLTLYNKMEPAAEGPAGSFISLKLLAMIIPVISFLFLTAILLIIDYRRNKPGRSHGHA